MEPAAGRNKKLPRTGELILARDGTPLIVLGRPKPLEGDHKLRRLRGLLEGTLVVLTPDGIPALHVPDAHATRPIFVQPWDWGWDPIEPPVPPPTSPG